MLTKLRSRYFKSRGHLGDVCIDGKAIVSRSLENFHV
jgi:hypothetical protein